MSVYTTFDGFSILSKFVIGNRWIANPRGVSDSLAKWSTSIQWIRPYFALKSNSTPWLVKYLTISRFVGLDVASPKELDIALRYTEPHNIIYTNPHSQKYTSSYLKVVDSVGELDRVSSASPLLVRIESCSGANAKCNFDSKFGATIDEAETIIKHAHQMGHVVKGISFHIGSGGEFCRRTAYKEAYKRTQLLLPLIKVSKPIINFGGGLNYDTDLVDALSWTRDIPYTMIAEPGRYFAAPSHHLAVKVVSSTRRGFFLDNGIYHELNVKNNDHWSLPKLTLWRKPNGDIVHVNEYKMSRLFGPTCDTGDDLGESHVPSDLKPGDTILLPNMGAYTNVAAIDFNGILPASSAPWDVKF